MKTTLIAALLVATALAPIAFTGASERSRVAVTQAWSRPAPRGMASAVVYLTIDNRGSQPDRLIRASTPVAARMELHRTSLRNGVVSMEVVPDGIELPPHRSVTLSPNGHHFMLTGLKTGLSAGSDFPATLEFAHGTPVSVHVQVRTTEPEPPMPGMKMP